MKPALIEHEVEGQRERRERVNYHVTARTFELHAKQIYERPAESVPREYILNAIDSLIRAGKSSDNVHVTTPTEEDPVLRIRDHGMGINDHDSMCRYFFDFNNSDKHSEANSTGEMGLGAKAAYAVADQFMVTTFTGKAKRTYVAMRDEHGYPTRPAYAPEWVPSDEQQGLLIEIPINFVPDKRHSIITGIREACKAIGHPNSPYTGHVKLDGHRYQYAFPQLPKDEDAVELVMRPRVSKLDNAIIWMEDETPTGNEHLGNLAIGNTRYVEFLSTSIISHDKLVVEGKLQPFAEFKSETTSADNSNRLFLANIVYSLDTSKKGLFYRLYLPNTQASGESHPIRFTPGRERILMDESLDYISQFVKREWLKVQREVLAQLNALIDSTESLEDLIKEYKSKRSLAKVCGVKDEYTANMTKRLRDLWPFEDIDPFSSIVDSVGDAGVIVSLDELYINRNNDVRRRKHSKFRWTERWYDLLYRAGNLRDIHLIVIGGNANLWLFRRDLDNATCGITCGSRKCSDAVYAKLRELTSGVIGGPTISQAPAAVRASTVNSRPPKTNDKSDLIEYAVSHTYKLNHRASSTAGVTDIWQSLSLHEVADLSDKKANVVNAYVPFNRYDVGCLRDTVREGSLTSRDDFARVSWLLGGLDCIVSTFSASGVDLRIFGVRSSQPEAMKIIGRPLGDVLAEFWLKYADAFTFADHYDQNAATDRRYQKPARDKEYDKTYLFPWECVISWMHTDISKLSPSSKLRKEVTRLRKVVPFETVSSIVYSAFRLGAVAETDKHIRNLLGLGDAYSNNRLYADDKLISRIKKLHGVVTYKGWSLDELREVDNELKGHYPLLAEIPGDMPDICLQLGYEASTKVLAYVYAMDKLHASKSGRDFLSGLTE